MVALLLSTVLFAVGAMTVDLGSLWVARAGLKGLAEAAALAGASELPQDPRGDLRPDVRKRVVEAAVQVLCARGNARPQWDAATCSDPRPAWAEDVREDNGEVAVTRAEVGAVPAIDTSENGILPWVVRVVTPPTTVTFGLARAFGQDSSSVSAAAGARRGMPFPVDALLADSGFPGPSFAPSPYYLTVDDLRDAQTKPERAVCLRTTPDPAETAVDVGDAPAPPTPGFLVGTPDTTEFTSFDPEPVKLTGVQFGDAVVPPANNDPIVPVPVRVLVGGTAVQLPATDVEVRWTGTSYEITFTTPDLNGARIFGPVSLWFEYPDQNAVSDSVQLTFPAAEVLPLVGDCDDAATPDGRGLLAPLDPATGDPAPVTRSVTDGLPVAVHPFGAFPKAQPLPSTNETCDAYSPGTSFAAPALRPATAADPDPDVNCVSLRDGGDVRPQDLTAAWLGTEGGGGVVGRLQRPCTSQRSTISGRTGTFDTTSLFRRSSGLTRSGTNRTALQARITTGRTADGAFVGAITTKAFRCPRFLMVPVLDTSRPPAAGRYPVVGLTYFWVSDVFDRGRPRAYRGLITTDDGSRRVVGIRGWVIDPLYVQGGDWVDSSSSLPMAVPRSAVLARTPCDRHPDSTPCGP